MKKLLSLLTLTLLFATLFVACDKEELTITESLDQQSEILVKGQEIPAFGDNTEEDLSKFPKDAENKSSWTFLRRVNINSSSQNQWQHIIGFSRATYDNFDLKAVATYSSRNGYVATVNQNSGGGLALLDYVGTSPGRTVEIQLTADDLPSNSTVGRFYTFSPSANTSYTVEIYYRRRQQPISAPSGWSLVSGSSKKGVSTFQRGNKRFMQVIDLSEGARIEPFAYPVQTNNNDQPTGSASNASTSTPNPNIIHQSVAYWWNSSYLRTRTRLYSVANATFFDHLGHGYFPNQCNTACASVFAVKNNGSVIVCGHGGNNTDQARIKRAFVINYSGSSNVISFGNRTDYSYVNSRLNNYKYGVVGFDLDDAPNANLPVQRAAIGASGTKVYIYTSNESELASSFPGLTTTESVFDDWGVSSSSVVMLDGSGSAQLNVLGNEKLDGDDRCVGSILAVYYGN